MKHSVTMTAIALVMAASSPAFAGSLTDSIATQTGINAGATANTQGIHRNRAAVGLNTNVGVNANDDETDGTGMNAGANVRAGTAGEASVEPAAGRGPSSPSGIKSQGSMGVGAGTNANTNRANTGAGAGVSGSASGGASSR